MNTSTANRKLSSVPEACRRLGIGRTKVYELIGSGQIKALKIGKRTLVEDDELDRVIAGLPAAKIGGHV